MKSSTTNLSQKQIQAIPFLVGSASVIKGCEAAGLATTTYYEWMKDPNFVEALQKAREEIMQNGLAILKNAIPQAAETLVQLLSYEQPPPVRRGAARDILDIVFDQQKAEQLEERLKALEERAKK